MPVLVLSIQTACQTSWLLQPRAGSTSFSIMISTCLSYEPGQPLDLPLIMVVPPNQMIL
jgi:hypothetical protein